MKLTEIEKALYKEKPTAKFVFCKKLDGKIYLSYCCDKPIGLAFPASFLFFRVPVEDVEDGIFPNELEAHLLIRYIVLPENTEA